MDYFVLILAFDW